MKRILFLLIILLSISVKAQSPGAVLLTGTSQDGIVIPYAGEAITIAATSIGFTAALISPTCTDCPLNTLRAVRADCVSETSAFFFRTLDNGTAPTTTIGKLLPAGVIFTVYGYDAIAAFRAIRTAGTSIAMYCTFSRPK